MPPSAKVPLRACKEMGSAPLYIGLTTIELPFYVLRGNDCPFVGANKWPPRASLVPNTAEGRRRSHVTLTEMAPTMLLGLLF